MNQILIVPVPHNRSVGNGLIQNLPVRLICLAISPHCARGILQNPTYEYIGGFSLLSDICAHAGNTHTADITSAHSPTKILPSFQFMIFTLHDLAQDLDIRPLS